MKTGKIKLLLEFLTEQLNHWLLMPGALTIIELSVRYTGHAGSGIGLWILCGLFPLFYYFIRSRFIGFFDRLLLHLAAAVPIPAFLFLQGKIIQFYLCAACAAGYAVYSLLNGEEPYTKPLHPVTGIILSAASILLLRYQNISGWDLYFILPLVVALALYALTVYIRQYLNFLSVNENSAGHLPASDMFRSGFMLVAGFVLIGTVILLLCANVGNYDNIWMTIKSRAVYFMRDLFSNLPRKEPKQNVSLTEAEMQAMDLQSQSVGLRERSMIFQILEIVAYVTVACFLAFCIAVSLFKFIMSLRLRLAQRGSKRPTPEEEPEPELDVREKCGVERITPKRKRITELLSPAERIRRLYKKRILASARELTDGNIPKLRIFTPKECGQRLEEEQMAQIYEQVRYSDKEATTDTLRRMKSALRHRGHSPEQDMSSAQEQGMLSEQKQGLSFEQGMKGDT